MDRKYSAFDVHVVPYKTVQEHKITAAIFVPKNLVAGKRPVLVRFHGGYLATGSNLFAEWFPRWLLEFAIDTGAILVSANYRLIPEATGLEVLEDVDDLWKWVETDLGTVLESKTQGRGLQVDLEHVAVVGDSAGGYLAAISALDHGKASGFNLRAAILAYPVLDLNAAHYTTACEKNIRGLANEPESILIDHLASMKPGTVVSDAVPPARLQLARTLVQYGVYTKYIGTDARLFPVERVRAGDRIDPALWIYHGDADTAVPIDGTHVFVKALKESQPDAKVLLTVHPGSEHGFDADPVALRTKWLQEGIAFVKQAWLGQ